MKPVIVFGMLALIAQALSIFLKRLDKEPENQVSTQGTVTGVVVDNDGYRKYFVSFIKDDERLIEQTYTYNPKSRRFKEGDKVLIKYFFTPKGKLRIKIDNKDMDDGTKSYATFIKVLSVTSLLLFILAGVLYIMHVI